MSKQKLDETKAALRDLGLNEDLDALQRTPLWRFGHHWGRVQRSLANVSAALSSAPVFCDYAIVSQAPDATGGPSFRCARPPTPSPSLPVSLLGLLLALIGDPRIAAGDLTLVDTGALWLLQPGTAEASSPDPTAWRGASFDASTWTASRLPVFYGQALAGTDLTDMRGRYTSVFLRCNVEVDRADEVAALDLGAICDGGFIAWLNGTEIARYNVPDGAVAFNRTASVEPINPVGFAAYPVTLPDGVLISGTNILAVQAFTTAATNDTDFAFDARLVATSDDAPPVVAALLPSPDRVLRSLDYIEVQFDEPVAGVEAADLLINDTPATGVVDLAPDDYLFTFLTPADGTVIVAWRADHGIVDRVPAHHPFAGGTWTYTLDSTLPASSLVLSEFMADNKRTLNDQDGDSSDWIEIANLGTAPASLDGWFLTDSRSNLAKWRFPNVAIAARGYLVVFASGKDRTNTTAKLHTNFKLSNNGGYLALVNPATNVVDDFAPAYPRQTTDVSYGRANGDLDSIGYFSKPTPGAANSTSGPGFAPEVGFSRISHPFTNAFDLTLSTFSTNSTIRYTIDGNIPTNTSLLYTAPLRITNSIQIRARAFAPDVLPGPVRTEYYVLLHTNVLGFVSDLPVLVLHSLGRGSPTTTKPMFAQMTVFEPVNGRTVLSAEPTATLRAGVQIRGSSTEGITKSSYKVELWNEYGIDSHHPLLGLPSESDWVLYAPNVYEPVLIHNPFIHQLSRDMGRYSPRTRFVEVYFNKTTGAVASTHYAGIYVLEEKIKIGSNRVDIDELEPENLTPPSVTGGYLLKIDRLDPGDGGLSAGGATMCYIDPKEPEIELAQRAPQLTYLRDYYNAFAKALNGTNWLNPTSGYAAYIDTQSWIDFHVLEVLSGNVDSLVLSTYFHKPRNAPIVFGPHWDFDRALGSTDGRDANPRVWSTGPFFSATWWTRLFADKDFWQRWVDRWQELRGSHFSLTNINALVDRFANEVRQAQPREYQKWRVTLRGGTYQSEVNLMKTWLSNRIDFIDRQITQPPTLSHPGGAIPPGFFLTLTAPTNATLYYTLNGTDPRAAQGNVGTNALTYSQPIRLDANARVVVRARDTTKRQTGGPPTASSTPWSRPIAATFVITIPTLRFAEIMFHPAPPPVGSTNTDDDFEFIELVNTGTTPLNLPGFRITNAVDFVFAPTSAVTRLDPGQRVLVVHSRAAFLQRYPTATGIAGEFSRSLSDDLDRLTLVGPLGELISDFVYHDDWQPLSDGLGFSLVAVDERTDPATLGTTAQWRLSAAPGGSPGITDPPPPSIPAVWVNEVLANPTPGEFDTVELFNPNRTPVDISGWFLSDNLHSPTKYRFPPGSILQPYAFLVLHESDFGVSGANGPGFGLDPDSDEIHMFSARLDGTLTGFHHGFGFGASPLGGSFGLHRLASGATAFVIQDRPTLGAPNAGPHIGPVVISELMYQPPAANGDESLGEYIELANIGPNPVPLFDPARPGFTWHLRGAVSFDFPTGLVLDSSATVVIVGFDPGTDLAALAQLRLRYPSIRNATVLGPWSGRLNNEGDAVHLLHPGAPYLAADGGILLRDETLEEVPYLPIAPWPASPAGLGTSLARRPDLSLAADPASWFAAVPSPGALDRDGDGLPDDWEAAYGLDADSPTGDSGRLGDPDHDSVLNRDEFAADTAPWIGPVHLEAAPLPDNPGWFAITFQRRAQHSYTLFERPPTPGAPWTVVAQFPATPTDQPAAVPIPVTGPSRWFRVRVD